MKILFKDLLNETMDIIRKYANDELVRKIVNGSQLDLVFTISITSNSINISTWVEDCLRVESHRIDNINIYNPTSSVRYYSKDLISIWVSPNWKSIRFYNIKFSDEDINHVFTDDDIKEILEKDPCIRFIGSIASSIEKSAECMDENGIIDTDILDTF
jgi:hypothetical protein